MALQYKEKWESGEASIGKNARSTLIARVWGDPRPISAGGDDADNPVVVIAYMGDQFPAYNEFGHVFTSYSNKHVGYGEWLFTGEYGSPSGDRQTNDASFSFTTGGGSQHITTSLSTVQGYGIPGPGNPPPPNWKQLIGMSTAEAAGVDIPVRKFSFKTTFYVTPSKMSAAYVSLVNSLTNVVNSDPVIIFVDGIQLVFQPGELRFENGDGSKRHGWEDWEFSLNWSAETNATNLQIGDITGIAKDGQDYLWVYYQPDTDGSNAAHRLIHTPQAVYVERVFDRQPLTPLLQTTAFGLANSQPWVGIPIGGGPLT